MNCDTARHAKEIVKRYKCTTYVCINKNKILTVFTGESATDYNINFDALDNGHVSRNM
jgi:hypothetical protein